MSLSCRSGRDAVQDVSLRSTVRGHVGRLSGERPGSPRPCKGEGESEGLFLPMRLLR